MNHENEIDMYDQILQDPHVYWSKRSKAAVTDEWGRPVHDAKGNPKTKWIALPAKRDFKADLKARVMEEGLTSAQADAVVKRAIDVQGDVLDNDKDGMLSTVIVADSMAYLVKDVVRLK